jgi:phospholipase C
MDTGAPMDDGARAPAVTRRRALRALGGLTAALSLSAVSLGSARAQNTPPDVQHQADQDDDERAARLPRPDRSGIEHIVLVMMENRSFDHILGWLPGHNGRQAGLSYTDSSGVRHMTHALAPDFQGCAFHDPDHSFSGGRVEYNNSRCDGWLRAGQNDLYSIGYYTRDDVPFFHQIASRFATPARYFSAFLGPTFPNRLFQHAGQTDRLSNTLVISTLPTIWDRLAAAGLSRTYYFSDIPVMALWGAKYLPISRPIASFFADAAAGTLPAVSFVDPAFAGEATGTTNDDHPFNDIRNGQVFLNSLYRAVTTGPRLAQDGVDHQLRRMGRVLRPRSTTARTGYPGRANPGLHRRSTRLPSALYYHLTLVTA